MNRTCFSLCLQIHVLQKPVEKEISVHLLNVHRLNKHPSIYLLLYLSTSTTHPPHLGLILHRLPSEATPDHPLHPSNLSSEGHKRENEAIRSAPISRSVYLISEISH
ncbi:unnamed protein product [Lactuca virosa]|uniref:Uncharacterized protein n=1 Tax=Lactuca virosa TaxID=75947 RepID=A0AAU9NCH3_9ASTR|nr:unnamed protein product [Lactuca virosa]